MPSQPVVKIGNQRHLRSTSARQAMSALGPVLYAIALGDGTVKLGWTGNLGNRVRTLRHYAGCEATVLAFAHGTPDDEAALHRELAPHLAHGREYYRPTPEVLAVVNDWRSRWGQEPIAELSFSGVAP